MLYLFSLSPGKPDLCAGVRFFSFLPPAAAGRHAEAMKRPYCHVVLQRCADYERSAVTAAVDAALRLLGPVNGLHGHTVLLKPNLISSSGPQLSCTHPQFIAGVADFFLCHGAKVLLGDSPAFGNTVRVCEKQGIRAALKGMDVQLINFIHPQPRRLAGGLTLTVAREALECDIFVGLPKVKAHNQLYMSLAVKNIFGIVKGINKAMLHMVHGNTHEEFSGIILDLLDLLPAQLHVADGIVAMHASGPLDGQPLQVSCVAAAHTAVAMDTALLNLLELEPRRSPLWQVAAARKLAGSDPATLEYPALRPEDFHGCGFIAPANLNPIRFNPFRFIRGVAARAALRFGF